MLKRTIPTKQSERDLATKAAMLMASRLNAVGVKTVVVSREEAEKTYREALTGGSPTEFSVADIQRLNYDWNGEEVSMKAFAQAFSPLIKNRDRTLKDAERIADGYIAAVKADPASFVPMLKPENMSHARYFILRDGSVWTPSHPMAQSPEYQTQRGLWEIYSRVLGDARMKDYVRLLDPSKRRSGDEDARFVSMEREVSASDLMQSSLEMNAKKVNEERVRAVKNLVQYFKGNVDYTPTEKALLLKGAMTWGVVDKKKSDGGNEVRLVRLTDANDICVPVVGGEAAAIVEGLRQGMNYKEAFQASLERGRENGKRSVPRNYTGWKLYPKSHREEDAVVLNQDASGTGWCTGSGLSTARSHLSGGDFHIYFEGGEPLIAIRTEDGHMAEPPRGAHEGQFCTDREEQIAFEYIRQGNGITAGDDYVSDIEDIRRIMSPEATWKDAFLMPEHRRYENGEYGGDTNAWGKAVEERIDSLLASVSVDERHREGYYFAKEIGTVYNPNFGSDSYFKIKQDIPSDVLYIKGDCQVHVNDLRNVRSFMGGLSISEGVDVQADALQSIEGCLIVRDGATLQAEALQSVGSHLCVYEGATLQADVLQSIEGDLDVYEGATLQANALQSVRGDLSIRDDATLQADALQKVGGGLYVDDRATLQVEALQSVKCTLSVHEGATLQANALQSVGGDLEFYERATMQANALQSVGGNLNVYEWATLQVDALQSVGGCLRVAERATMQADALQSVGGYLVVYEGATLRANALQSVEGTLSVYEGATLRADALQSVGGSLYVEKRATLQVGAMQSVRGDLIVDEMATLHTNTLQSVEGTLSVRLGATMHANALQSVGGDLFVSKGAILQANALQSIRGDLKVQDGATFKSKSFTNYSLSDGTVYGYQYNDVIYLTPEGINPNTPIHEYAHLWAKAYARLHPEGWEAVKADLKELPLWESVSRSRDYAFLSWNDDRIAGEVLARLTGDAGEEMLLQAAREVLSSDIPEESLVTATVEHFRSNVNDSIVSEVFGVNDVRRLTLGILVDYAEGRAALSRDDRELAASVSRERSAEGLEFSVVKRSDVIQKRLPRGLKPFVAEGGAVCVDCGGSFRQVPEDGLFVVRGNDGDACKIYDRKTFSTLFDVLSDRVARRKTGTEKKASSTRKLKIS